MSVLIGSARINEKGGINGGAAGDQTGGEVSTQSWYLHSKGWIVIRAKDPSVREKIARNMQAICNNDNIGYCQNHRGTLTAAAKPYGYDASQVAKKVEVDCSEAVRNCVLYAGISVGSFSTASEVSKLKATGKFDILKDDLHCKSSDYLLRGDILVTRTKGHTVVALSNGAKVSGSAGGNKADKKLDRDAIRSLQEALNADGIRDRDRNKLVVDGKKGSLTTSAIAKVLLKAGAFNTVRGRYTVGSTGEVVKWLQMRLNTVIGDSIVELLGAALEPDGKFGDGTRLAVGLFQELRGLKIDYLVGVSTITELLMAV